jgi:uncharacterized protein
MTEDIAKQAVRFASKINPLNTGIIFFGGEPLLKKELIKSTIGYCNQLQIEENLHFHHKLTTNGLLIDEDFMNFASKENLIVALSFDGIEKSHDFHRKSPNDKGSFDLIEPKIDLILNHQPYSQVLMTVTPETVQYYSDSVEFLFSKGFKYLIISLDYSGKWNSKSLTELEKQYKKISNLYEKKITNEDKFYFSPFETKFASYIRKNQEKHFRCQLGINQLSVAYNGDIYSCIQFVQDHISNTQYKIGNVLTGIDENKRNKMYIKAKTLDEECSDCDLKDRCRNDCACLNWQTGKTLNKVTPVVCETEKILISIVDKLGERLYNKRAPMFIQKHYNKAYPYLSVLEDIANNEDEDYR